MGIIRKATSIGTLGTVKYRTPNQKTARYAKKSYKLQRSQAQGDLDPATARQGLIVLGIIVGVLVLVIAIGAFVGAVS